MRDDDERTIEGIQLVGRGNGDIDLKWLLTLLVIIVYLLHQDFWLWSDRSLVLGFLPVGLAYHAGYSLLAAGMMALLVRFAWPAQLERDTPESADEISEAAQ